MTLVPPVAGPLTGSTRTTVATASYTNCSVEWLLSWSLMLTRTVDDPTALAGVRHRMRSVVSNVAHTLAAPKMQLRV